MENWKLGYPMWVVDRVVRHPVVLSSLKRERCHYILNSTSRCLCADLKKLLNTIEINV